MTLSNGSIRVFRAFGIDVHLHWAWLVLAFIAVQQSDRYGRGGWGWALAEFLAVFALVLLHEFGHALACKSVGGTADRIVLWILGGVAYARPPQRPGALLWTVAAGPLVNVVLVPATMLLAATQVNLADLDIAAMTNWQKFCCYLVFINFSLLFLNLLPVFPLDGGQILQAILWFFIGQARSLRVVSVIGLIAACIGGVWALSVGNLWLMVLFAFVAMSAWNGYRVARHLWAMEQAQAAHLAAVAQSLAMSPQGVYYPPTWQGSSASWPPGDASAPPAGWYPPPPPPPPAPPAPPVGPYPWSPPAPPRS